MENRGKILIADDELDIRELLADYLESEGYECLLAANAFEALELYDKNRDIDIIISDIRMPGQSGLEMLGKIKEKDSEAIVVMISAVKDIDAAIEAMSKGAYDYVAKPFKLNEVSFVAKKAIEKRRLILENRAYQEELEKKVEERTKELKQALEEFDRTYNFTLRALVTALDTKDSDTQGHSLRVVRYTLKLAELMNITDTGEGKILEYGSLLHDIGKIGIPDAILRKPGKLTPEEWAIMRTHPDVGYQILHKIEFLEDSAQIVLSHHELFNGEGYPNRLKGKDIPLGARIFAIADTVDAITSPRFYREAQSFEVASSELKKHSNKQFDPDVVDAFHSIELDWWKGKRRQIDEAIKENSDIY